MAMSYRYAFKVAWESFKGTKKIPFNGKLFHNYKPDEHRQFPIALGEGNKYRNVGCGNSIPSISSNKSPEINHAKIVRKCSSAVKSDNHLVFTCDNTDISQGNRLRIHTKCGESVFSNRDRLNANRISFASDEMTQPWTVLVEGNIGSGKTTFLKHFKKFPDVCVLDEPISKWRDCQGYNLLDLMYKDPRKWSLCFQSYVQLTMLDLHIKPIVQPIKMMERSIFSAQYCFVQNLRDEGLMDDPQYAVLSEWFDFSTASLPIKVDLIVYLRTDPEVAYKRIGQRGRSEENSIKLEYLQSVHKHHEDWLIHKQKSLPCPVLTIDANTELADMTPNYQLCEERMFQFQNSAAVANC